LHPPWSIFPVQPQLEQSSHHQELDQQLLDKMGGLSVPFTFYLQPTHDPITDSAALKPNGSNSGNANFPRVQTGVTHPPAKTSGPMRASAAPFQPRITPKLEQRS
jgi:hypothetical protein